MNKKKRFPWTFIIIILTLLILSGLWLSYGRYAYALSKASALYEEGDYLHAVMLYKSESKESLFKVEDSIHMAYCEYYLERYEDSLRTLDNIGDISVEDIEYKVEKEYLIGMNRFFLKDYSNALLHFNEAVEFGISNADKYFALQIYRAQCYNLSKDPEGCILVLEELIPRLSKKQQLQVAYSLKGQACIDKGDYNGALDCFNKVQAINPEDIEPYITTAYIYDKTEGSGYMLKYLKGLRERFPGNKELEELISCRENY